MNFATNFQIPIYARYIWYYETASPNAEAKKSPDKLDVLDIKVFLRE